MKKTLFTACFILSAFFNYAQSYQWITGGGSATDISHLPGYAWEGTRDAVTDAHGNLYFASSLGWNDIKADTFFVLATHNAGVGAVNSILASYNCDGTIRWAKVFESANNETFLGAIVSGGNSAIAYSNGSIYVTGVFGGGNYSYIDYDTTIASEYASSFTARFDTSGKFKWIRFIGQDSASIETLAGFPGIVAVDAQGYVHNFAYMEPGVLLTPTFTTGSSGTYDLKYDSSGNLVSVARVPLPADTLWLPSKVIFSNSGTYYALLGPNTTSPYWTSTSNSAIAAFSSSGTMLWWDTTGANGYMSGFDYKGGNEIYVCGNGQYGLGPHPDTFSFGGISVTDTIFPTYYAFETIFQLDTNGAAHWVYNLQGNEGGMLFSDITVLPGGKKIAATGSFVGKQIHGPDTLTCTYAGGYNPLVVIVDNNGNTVKLDQLYEDDGYDGSAGTCITSDAIGNIYIGGMVTDSVAATGLSAYHSNGGNTDFYICKYGYSNCDSVAAVATASPVIPTRGETIRVYPNPAMDELNVAGLQQITNYQLLTITGVVMQQGIMQPGENAIRIPNCAPGIYIMEMNGVDGTRNVARVVKE